MVDNAKKEKDDSEKNDKKVELKKNPKKQKGRQSQLSTQLGKVHKKPNWVILKVVIKEIKSLMKLVGWKVTRIPETTSVCFFCRNR